jgi:hypothetical protein
MPKNRQARVRRRAPTNSNASHDFFAEPVGASWALRRAKKSEQRMLESLERMHATGETLRSDQPGAPSRPSAGRRRIRDPLLKHVVLYGAFLVLRPLLTAVVAAAMAWAMWEVFWWLI